MQTTGDHSVDPGIRQFLSAWEEALALQRGRTEGLAQGIHLTLSIILAQRFGDASLPLLQRIEASTDLRWFKTLVVRVTQGAELSELEALPRSEDVATSQRSPGPGRVKASSPLS